MLNGHFGKIPFAKPSNLGVSSAEVAINCQEMY